MFSIFVAGNGLTDLSLQHLITHLLADVPTLTHLYLNNNSIALANPQIVTSLACTLSSPRSTLRALSLTSNSAIDAASLGRLLRELDLGKGSNFEQLHFSVCSLGPDAVSPLVSFLESPERGGNERLQVLALNANSLYDIGVRRIARIVSSGRNVGLLSLELLANQPADDTGMKADWAEILAELELEEARNGGVDNEWKDGLTRGLERNRRLFRETRICALGMLGKGRVLFGGRPREGEEETAFPFLRLPIELQVHVYRCSLLLDPSNEAHLYTRRPSPPFPSPSILSSPLTESQFLHLLAHVASEDTFATEIRLATPKAVEGEEGRVLGGGTGKVGMNERGEESWAEWALWSVGCDRFMLG